MNEVKIYLSEFESLEEEIEVVTYEDEVHGQKVIEYDYYKGFIRVSQEELAEVLGNELKYQINEFKNFNPTWDFEYKFEADGFQLEVSKIKKILEGKVYFDI